MNEYRFDSSSTEPQWAYIYEECRHSLWRRIILILLGRHRHVTLWVDGTGPITDPLEISWTVSGLFRMEDDE